MREVLDTLERLEVEFHPDALLPGVEERKRMAAEAVHVTIAVWRAAVAHEDEHLVQAFRVERPEVPHHGRALAVGTRVALLGVNEIAKFFGVLDKKHRGVVPDQVPVAVLGVELHRKAARVALGVGAAFLASHRGEAHEHPRLLADLTEQLRPGVGRDVVRDRKRAVGASALGVHDALWNAFAVEVRHFLVQDVVLQQNGATWANGHGIVVLDVGPT